MKISYQNRLGCVNTIKGVNVITPTDILNAWIKYSEYEPEQKRFNLLSSKYYMHNATEKAAAIRDYDPSGALAVLYLKEMFRRLCKESSFNMMALMEHPEGLDEHKRMWDMFHSEDVKTIEDSILGAMDGIIRKIVPVKQIGERDLDAERGVLAESIMGVVEELNKCHVECFLKSGSMGQISSFSTELHVFDTLSQCLLTLEGAPDSMYICYIRNRDTADGYFGFFIKPNGNLLSINERVREAYPGQHINARNGRWSESKAYQVFPYELMKDIGERDYLGYAHHLCIDDSNLKLFALGPGGYIPLVLSMVMLSVKYSGLPTDSYPLTYVDSLLPRNLELSQSSEETALTIPENSLVVSGHKTYAIDLTTEDVLTGRAGAHFDHQALRAAGIEKHYTATGSFPQTENIFINLYGAGFELDKDALLERNRVLLLPSPTGFPEEKIENFEFVGGKDQLDIIAYRAARIQLAEYIRDQMYKEYVSFGGVEAVRSWFNTLVLQHKDDLLRLCVEAFAEAEQNKEDMSATMLSTLFQKRRQSGLMIGVELCKSGVSTYGYHPFNQTLIGNFKKFGCVLDRSTKATYDFKIIFSDWKELAQVFGEGSIPKILKGYHRDGHDYTGNSNLDCVDYAQGVGTPFEEREYRRNKRYWTEHEWRDHLGWTSEEFKSISAEQLPKKSPIMNFGVSIALSKRGINKILKEMSP